ncbi:MAG: FG-GAP-like repeat-containing protein, partial [Bacteroidales bacterium]|nr:FG-GAP-like repeat-containing protein [Bacteroidales bacterium]
YSTIYKNNLPVSEGLSLQSDITLTGGSFAKSTFADYNCDGLLDILVCGEYPSTLYKNNGDNTFTEVSTAVLNAVMEGSVVWGDYDNDGLLDIASTGNGVTAIFKNNGDDTFTNSNSLIGLSRSLAAWGDYDGDKDLDLIVSGENVSSELVTKIYRKNSSISNTSPSVPSMLSSRQSENTMILSWEASDDNQTASEGLSYNIYIKNSEEDYIMSPHFDFSTSSRTIVDFGNTELDTFFVVRNLPCGEYSWSVQAIDNTFKASDFAPKSNFIFTPQPTDVVVQNIGTTKAELTWISQEGMYSNIEIGITGHSIGEGEILRSVSSPYSFTNLLPEETYEVYVRDSCGPGLVSDWTGPIEFTLNTFFEDVDLGIDNLFYDGRSIWVDTDSDGYLDLLQIGKVNLIPSTQLYRNVGSGPFSPVSTGITNMSSGEIAAGDYNNDDLVDIALVGIDESGNKCAKLFKNEGGNSFSEVVIGLTPISNGDIELSDFDKDGDLDILISGLSENGIVTQIFTNNRDDSFDLHNIEVKGCQFGFIEIADFNNDSYPDIYIRGRDIDGNYHNSLYKNEKELSFTLINQSFLRSETADWGDYDNDGDLDLLIERNIYRNNGDETFSLIEPQIPGEDTGTSKWIDIDNDGDLDYIFSSLDIYGTTFHMNNGLGEFIPSEIFFPSYLTRHFSIGDYDSDNDLDILLNGNYDESEDYTKILNNAMDEWNRYPGSPTNLTSRVLGQKTVLLSWDNASDTETPSEALSYNIKIGSSIGGFEIVSALAGSPGLYRRLPLAGNAGSSTQYIIENLPQGNYYWSVQSIDNGLEASAFTNGGTFEIQPLF